MVRHHVIKRALASGLVIAAAGLPSAAQAMPPGGAASPVPVAPASSGPSAQQRRLDELQRNVEAWFDVHGHFLPSMAVTAPVPTAAAAVSPRGFQWDDAGIGAAGATALLCAAALGVGLTRRQRRAAVR
jgi:hypothetical protein